MPDKSAHDDAGAAGNDGNDGTDQTDKSATNDGKPRKPSSDDIPQEEKGNFISNMTDLK